MSAARARTQAGNGRRRLLTTVTYQSFSQSTLKQKICPKKAEATWTQAYQVQRQVSADCDCLTWCGNGITPSRSCSSILCNIGTSPPHLGWWRCFQGAKARVKGEGQIAATGRHQAKCSLSAFRWKRKSLVRAAWEELWHGGQGYSCCSSEEGGEEGLLFNCQPSFHQQIQGRAVTGVEGSRWPNCEILPCKSKIIYCF